MMEKRNNGFTIIELLATIAISGILIAIATSSFSSLSNSKSLERDVTNSLSYIERARMQTINGTNFSVYGIKLASTSITIFPGSTYDASNASNTVYLFGPNTKISSVDLSNGTTTFYFQKLSGKPTATGVINFAWGNSSSTKSIIINGAGIVEMQ